MCKYIKTLILLTLISLLFLSFSCVEKNMYETSLEESLKLLQFVLNDNIPKQERMDALLVLTNSISNLLGTEESIYLSDTELEEIFFNYITVTSKVFDCEESKLTIRVVSYLGPVELNDSHSRTWTFIQWWDDNSVNSQTLIGGGPETVTDFIPQRAIENNVVELVGYTEAYFPPVVFSKSYILNNNVWEAFLVPSVEAFNLKAYWYFEQYDELLLIDHAVSGSVHVKTREQGNGFYVYSDMNPRDKLYLIFNDGTFKYDVYQSPHLIINSSGKTSDQINIFSGVEIDMPDITDDDLSALNFSEVVELDSSEAYESLDDSEYMVAKAAYLTTISEYRSYIVAIQKAALLFTGAHLANEPKYQYLQAGEMHKYYNLLLDNLSEQRSIIQVMLKELPNYYLNQELDEVLVAYIEQFINNGFSEEEVMFYLNTEKTNEEIEEYQNALKLFFEELSSDAYYINEISAGLNEQLIMIDEQQEIIEQAISELEEINFYN